MFFDTKSCIAVLPMMAVLAEAVTITSLVGRNSSLTLHTATASSRHNASMCGVHGDDFSTACSCMELYNSRATTYDTTVTGALTETGQYAYAEFYSTRPTTISFTNTYTTVVMTDVGYTPPDNCCADWCQIDADSVRILYWPVDTNGTNTTKASNESITTAPSPSGVVSGGMTFTSPSVYVAYTNINAHKICGSFGSVFLGRNYNTTIAYPPDALSTSKGATPNQAAAQRRPNQYTAINYTDFQAYSLPDKPIFSLPTELSNIDSKWAKCFPAAYGAFDPPRVLAQATAMVPSIQTPPAASPAAQASATIVLATPTPMPKPGDPGSGGQPVVPQLPQSQKPGPQESDPQSSVGAQNDPGSGKGGVVAGGQQSNSPGASQSDPSKGGLSNGAPSNSGAGSNPGSGTGADPGSKSGSDSGSGSGPGPGPGSNSGSGSSSGSGSGSNPSSGSGPGVGSGSNPESNSGSGSGAGSNSGSGPGFVSPQAASAPPSIGGQPVVQGPNNGIIIGSSTYTPGTQAQISGVTVSVANGHYIANGVSYAIPISAPTSPPLIAGQPSQIAPNGGVIAAGTTIPPGSSATIAGHVVLAGSSHAVIAGSTINPGPAAPTSVLIAGQPVQIAPNGGIIVAGTTLAPGNVATISGHIVSAATSYAVIDGSSVNVPSTNPTPILIAGQPLQIAPNGGIIVAGSTLAPGSVATISGHIVSAAASFAIIDGSTAFPHPTPPSQALTFANGAIASAGGAPIIVFGTTYSIPPSANSIVVNGQTKPLPTAPPQSVFTIAGQIFTANPTGFAIGAQSVALNGAAVTIAGTVVSLGPGGLQIASSTVPLTPAQGTGGAGLGGVIMSGFGSGNGSGSAPLVFTGKGTRVGEGLQSAGIAVIAITMGVFAVML